MTLTAEKVTGNEVQLRLVGSAQEKTHHFHGVIGVDLRKSKFTRFDMVWYSEWGEAEHLTVGSPTESYSPIGAAFELSSREKPIDRLYPHLWTQFWRDDHRPVREAYFSTGR